MYLESTAKLLMLVYSWGPFPLLSMVYRCFPDLWNTAILLVWKSPMYISFPSIRILSIPLTIPFSHVSRGRSEILSTNSLTVCLARVLLLMVSWNVMIDCLLSWHDTSRKQQNINMDIVLINKYWFCFLLNWNVG